VTGQAEIERKFFLCTESILPDPSFKIPKKIAKQIQIMKKHHPGLISS